MLTKYEEEEKDITEINIESIEVVRDNDIGNADNTIPQLRTFICHQYILDVF